MVRRGEDARGDARDIADCARSRSQSIQTIFYFCRPPPARQLPPAPRPPLGSPVRLSALYGASDGRRYILLQMYPDPASDCHGASDFVHVLLVRVLKYAA